ncbi:MAG: alpha/beta hydrolase [Candidatus Promineifilaceae bacterium]
MKKTLAIILYLWLLLIVSCTNAAPTSSPVIESPIPEPTATSVPPTDAPPTQLPELPRRNVPYIPEAGLLQTLDVHTPSTGDGPFPTILAIHGGGFSGGNKSSYSELASHFNELGYALVSSNYRLTSTSSYPEQVEDVFCALAWVHENSVAYGFDDERIFIMGDSAGGYLTAMLGTVDAPDLYLENCPHALPDADWIQGVVVFYGFFDFLSIEGFPDVRSNLQPYWGAKHSDIALDTLAEMSPASWVDGGEPPFLLLHGTSDTLVPSWMSEDFATVLEEAGVEVELVLIPETEHAFIRQHFSSPAMELALNSTEAFLSKVSEQ